MTNTLEDVVKGFLAAHEAYGCKGSLLMLSDENVEESNMFD
jgi:hypothetical protein